MNAPTTAHQLSRDVASGRISAVEIVENSFAAMRQHEPMMNAVAVPLPGMARELARKVDAQVRRGEDPGPLAGVPFTVKECYHVTGTPHSLGREGATERAHRNSPIVDKLIAAGAVPVAKTNLSQLMLLYETDNPRYGRTLHPQDFARSPGGSGGGDAAALASGYASFAMGTDMGGSIRHPAHCCGLAAFLPTRHRIETAGVERILPGTGPLDLQAAPMARRIEDLELVMEVLTEEGTSDSCIAAPWSQRRPSVSQMRIGYFDSEQYFPTCPTARRAVNESVATLERAGAELTMMAPPCLKTAVHLFCGAFGADGGQHIRQQLRGEQVDWRTKPLLRMGRLPRILRTCVARALELCGQRRLAGIIDHSYRCSAATLWQLTEAIALYRAAFFRQMRSLGIDAVVMPSHPTVAYRHGGSDNMLPANGYSILANLLGAPAGVVNVTKVREDEQTMEIDRRSRCERSALQNLAGSAGLPCGVQALAAPWEDRTALSVLQHLQQNAGAAEAAAEPELATCTGACPAN